MVREERGGAGGHPPRGQRIQGVCWGKGETIAVRALGVVGGAGGDLGNGAGEGSDPAGGAQKRVSGGGSGASGPRAAGRSGDRLSEQSICSAGPLPGESLLRGAAL